jgi:hypothetical protein
MRYGQPLFLPLLTGAPQLASPFSLSVIIAKPLTSRRVHQTLLRYVAVVTVLVWTAFWPISRRLVGAVVVTWRAVGVLRPMHTLCKDGSDIDEARAPSIAPPSVRLRLTRSPLISRGFHAVCRKRRALRARTCEKCPISGQIGVQPVCFCLRQLESPTLHIKFPGTIFSQPGLTLASSQVEELCRAGIHWTGMEFIF